MPCFFWGGDMGIRDGIQSLTCRVYYHFTTELYLWPSGYVFSLPPPDHSL